jgi:hypothetical protein
MAIMNLQSLFKDWRFKKKLERKETRTLISIPIDIICKEFGAWNKRIEESPGGNS